VRNREEKPKQRARNVSLFDDRNCGRFYTPHKDGFVQEKRLKAGNNLQVEVEFSLNFVAGYELFSN
jgi:hypothetical protein